MNTDLKIILIHGNGGGLATDHWFPSTKTALEALGFEVIAKDFPDNQVAHENVWIPFIKDTLKADEKTILIGHSSGAVASLRYAEKYPILGSVLVGVNYTDLGDATEKESGYYNHPWNWRSIENNQKWILQFASTDDPYIPIAEPRFIHEQLNTEYHEYTDKGHFMIPEFPDLITILKRKLNLE
jgi:predicted alpha/beta hydrolase family esterase